MPVTVVWHRNSLRSVTLYFLCITLIFTLWNLLSYNYWDSKLNEQEQIYSRFWLMIKVVKCGVLILAIIAITKPTEDSSYYRVRFSIKSVIVVSLMECFLAVWLEALLYIRVIKGGDDGIFLRNTLLIWIYLLLQISSILVFRSYLKELKQNQLGGISAQPNTHDQAASPADGLVIHIPQYPSQPSQNVTVTLQYATPVPKDSTRPPPYSSLFHPPQPAQRSESA